MKHLFLNTYCLALFLLGLASLFPQNAKSQDIGFIENRGQFLDEQGNSNDQILFMGQSNGMAFQIYEDHFSYEIRNHKKTENHSRFHKNHESEAEEFELSYSRVEYYFEGNAKRILKDQPHSETLNYFINGKRVNNVMVYDRVVLEDIIEGIHLEFLLLEGKFKYNIIAESQLALNAFNLEIKGGNAIDLQNNQLSITTQNGVINEFMPTSYWRGPAQQEVQVEYILEKRKLAFNFNDTWQGELVIDPIPDIEWGTYVGGTGMDYVQAVEVDPDQNIYSTGFCTSASNIATVGAYDETIAGIADVFLLKYDKDGNKIWGTYFGGTSMDRCYGITYSADDFVFICGNTMSAGMATPGVHQEFQVNADEAFLAKFSPDGNLEWSTYYGGEEHDFAAVVATDEFGYSYITGHTYSTTLIATAGAYKVTYTGVSNAFVAKFDNDGVLFWATYFGEQLEEGWGIGCDESNDVYVGGGTQSTFGIASAGVHQETYGGVNDAFVAKFDTDGAFQWGTYYGGPELEQGLAMDVRSDGVTYLGGITMSSSDVAYGDVYQPAPNSVDDGFVAKFANDGTMIWATYVGGTGADYIYGLDYGIDSNIVVCGMSLSDDYLASPAAYDPDYNTIYDGFLVSIDEDGDYRFGSYIGGEAHDEPRDLVVDPKNLRIIVGGWTESTVDISTVGAEEETYLGSSDGFMVKYCNPITPKMNFTDSVTVCSAAPDTLVLLNPDDFDSFIWSTAETNDSLFLDGLTDGMYTYYINGVDTNACETVSDTLHLLFITAELPSIMTSAVELCADDTLEIWTDSGYVSYSWSTGGTDSLELLVDYTDYGYQEFIVEVEDTSGCILVSDPVGVIINPLPNPSIVVGNAGQLCINDTVLLSVADTFSTYLWSNSDDIYMTENIYPTAGFYLVDVMVVDANGCIGYDTLELSIDACDIGYQELELGGLTMFPNPANKELNLRANEATTIRLYTADGKLMIDHQLNEGEVWVLDVSSFAAGTYTLVALTASAQSTQKIVIAH